jgi:hypothetical protein
MSTPLIDEDSPEFSGVYFTRLYGGNDLGVCYQITIAYGSYVQLTRSQLDAVIAAYKNEPPL